MTETKNLGNLGEAIAKEYLLKKGYTFLNQNYIANKLELDLIFSFKQKIIFIEVKTRIKTLDSIQENPLTKWQTKNLNRAMINYCFEHHINLDQAQLDLIIILINKATRQAELKHYPDIL
jgi:putative endonuclease